MHSDKGSPVGQLAAEWVDGHLVHEAVIGSGGAWTPHDQRADWVKERVSSDTAEASSQCVFFWVKFRT